MGMFSFLFGPPKIERMAKRGNFKDLVRALTHKIPLVRMQVAEHFGETGETKAVEPLIRALKDEDGEVRGHAIRALEKIGDARAVEPLIQTLEDEYLGIRTSGIRALGAIGDARAVEPLNKALKDEDHGIQMAAFYSLREIGNERAVDIIIQALSSHNWTVRVEAAETLDDLSWKPAREEQKTYYLIAKEEWREVIEEGKLSVLPLIQTLRVDCAPVRKEAAEALGEIGDARAVKSLIRLLGDKDHIIYQRFDDDSVEISGSVQFAVADALGKIGDKMAVPALIQALRSRDFIATWSAVRALGNIGDVSAVDYLTEHLSSDEALEALTKIKDPKVVEVLIQKLKGGHGSANVQIAAARILGRIRDSKAVEPLIKALSDEYWEVRREAAWALGMIGDARAVEPLLRVRSDDEDGQVRSVAADALTQLEHQLQGLLVYLLEHLSKQAEGFL